MSVIKVHVDSEMDLYEKFDEDQQLLSDGLLSFLKRQHDRNRHGEIPTIRFISTVPIREEKLRTVLTYNVERALEKNRADWKKNIFSELYLFLIGLVCIVAGVLLSNITGIVALQLLSLTAGFAIKEAANIQFVTIPKNRLEARELRFISRAELEFVYS